MKHLRVLSAPRPAQLFSPGPLADLIANLSRAFFDFKFTFFFERIPPGTGGGGVGGGGTPPPGGIF